MFRDFAYKRDAHTSAMRSNISNPAAGGYYEGCPCFCGSAIALHRCPGSRSMIQLQNILLPTDFSEPALQATWYALDLAERFDAKLHLLHVIEDPIVYLPIFDSSPMPSREEFEAYAQTRLENWILPEDARQCELVFRWTHGSPVAQILRDAKDHSMDMIVLGTHGRGVTAHFLMGSVAERVVRQAPCPVLTVRPEGHQFVHPASVSET